MSQSGTISPGNTIPGKLIAQSSFMSNAVVTINDGVASAIGYDNTIPQITEGVQIATITHTPENANNILYLRLETQGNSGSEFSAVALFQGVGPNAIAARNCDTRIEGGFLTLTHRMVSGVAAPITFTWRAGLSTVGFGDILYVNGDNLGNPIYGGTSYIIAYIYEFQP